MIECVDSNIWYIKKNKSVKKHKKIKFIIIPLIFIFVFLYYKFFVFNQIYSYVLSSFDSISAECETKTISTIFSDTKYSDLVNIEKNASGEISYISINSQLTNKLGAESTEYTKIILSSKLNSGIPIPFLAFTGIGFLSGYGANVQFKTLSVSKVTFDYIDEFKSVGINQTVHTLYININANVIVSMPFLSNEKVVTQKIMVTNGIIVGKIPEIYLNK